MVAAFIQLLTTSRRRPLCDNYSCQSLTNNVNDSLFVTCSSHVSIILLLTMQPHDVDYQVEASSSFLLLLHLLLIFLLFSSFFPSSSYLFSPFRITYSPSSFSYSSATPHSPSYNPFPAAPLLSLSSSPSSSSSRSTTFSVSTCHLICSLTVDAQNSSGTDSTNELSSGPVPKYLERLKAICYALEISTAQARIHRGRQKCPNMYNLYARPTYIFR